MVSSSTAGGCVYMALCFIMRGREEFCGSNLEHEGCRHYTSDPQVPRTCMGKGFVGLCMTTKCRSRVFGRRGFPSRRSGGLTAHRFAHGLTAGGTAWAPPIAAIADGVSLLSGTVAAVTDTYFFARKEVGLTTVILDGVALIPGVSIVKEGMGFFDKFQLQNIMHSIQYASSEFSHMSDDEAWDVIRGTHLDLGGAIVSTGSSLASNNAEAHDKSRRLPNEGGSWFSCEIESCTRDVQCVPMWNWARV